MVRVLGLDLGPNSIGWALTEEDGNDRGRLVDCGVRVFPEGVDAFDTAKESSRNEQRRMARMMRRQIRRRARRRRIVEAALVEAGLLPADESQRRVVLALDPYPLRAAAMERALGAFEIGRIIYHLNQRRGFLSLKKLSKKRLESELKKIAKREATGPEAGDGAAKEDDSAMLAQIAMLAERLGDRTLGQVLRQQQTDGGDIPVRIRGQHTNRKMIEDEFLRIWEFQKACHPELLTDAACFGTVGRQDAQRTRSGVPRDPSLTLLQQFGLHGIIFHQRPIYWPREMIGMCELEPGQRRCPRADRRAQLFRMLQEINNLRYTLPGRFEETPLDDEQRAALLAKLYTTEKLTFDQIRKLLGFIDGVSFNLERGERSSIKGCETDVRLAKEWKQWHKLDEAKRDRIVRVLVDAARDAAEARDRLLGECQLPADDADALLSVDLPQGYVRFSLKAINRLLPHLERGLILMGRSDADASAMHAAGYLRRDELQRRLFDRLPSLSMIHSGPLADLPNPVVKAALYELRRVVNAIVREYGKPDAVHVEMARSLKMGQKARREYNQRIHERGDERERIAGILRQAKVAPTRDAVLKYRLWQEQKEQCVYTGRPISFQQLYDGSTDIDHILPYSLTLDDSQMNKVVCFRDSNHYKGQRSPWQWLGGTDPKRLEEIEQRGACLPWNKRRKLVQEEIKTDDFIARQLVDTGYIARLAVTYLEMLVEKKHDVQGRKGTYTADLRRHWGLGDVIESLPDSPAWQEKANLAAGEKNRADHRHHALDAIVIALTGRRTLAAMHQGKELVHHIDKDTGEVVEYQRFVKDTPPPWGMDSTEFRAMVLEKLGGILVSRRTQRKISGKLHDDRPFGAVYDPQARARVPGVFVKRRDVESLSASDIESIRDAAVRACILEHLKQRAVTVARSAPAKGRPKVYFADEHGSELSDKQKQAALSGVLLGGKTPVRRVRVLEKSDAIRPIREGTDHQSYVNPGNTHHLEFFEWEERGERQRHVEFVTMLDAVKRIREGQPLVRRVLPTQPGARFLFSLAAGEMVLAKWKGGEKLLTFKTAASTQGQLYFAEHCDARRQYRRFVANRNTLDARKVTVDPLGRVRWAND